MAFFCHNSSIYLGSTLVLLLRIPFNTISHFSNNLIRVYLSNTWQYSRYIYQRDQSFPRFPTCTIQSAWTVLPVFSPSIVSVNNDSNWKDAPATNPATNKSNSLAYFQLKLWYSDNTNEQLANILSYISTTLTANQTSGPNSNSRGAKAYILNTFSNTEPDKFNNFLF